MRVTAALSGRRIECALTDGARLRLVCEDGFEVDIAWVDDDGEPLKGKPIAVFEGKRLHVNGQPVLHRSEVGL